ncbi:MAG: ABC transporter ATP-binding protein [Acidimicrobiales bacterium]|nr:ABC transporter ATP-binding protein [Acidimicrobiales bacterium]
MLEVAGLTVRFGPTTALDDVDLTVGDGEVVCVLGPSGCGKSTLLRAVAGLEAPAAGQVRWDGDDLAGVPPHRRGFGLMFQEHALFPHRDVGGNVGFGLRMQRRPAVEIDRRVAELLDLVGLPGTQRREVGALSGGEQQRVALARALAPAPRLLMLDEPFGSLDRPLRERLTVEVGALLRRLGTTALHVTHDHDEAFALADRLVVLRSGGVEQVGRPQELWSRPATAFVARFLGLANVLDPAEAAALELLPTGAGAGAGADAAVLVPAPAIHLQGPGGPGLAATVQARSFRGDHTRVVVSTHTGTTLEATTRDSPPDVGDSVRLAVDRDAIRALSG